ncbi:MAG: polysaccharide deacetylase family protein [Peptostreptococcaceae bacterium]|nr:polysaccharide deacetylase family protein [Peptostreptococcaceae bacterium]
MIKTIQFLGIVWGLYALLPTIYYKYLRRMKRKDRSIRLTFDDGPDPQYTEMLLDLLKEHQVKATFFVIAEKAQRHPDIIKQISAQGHEIGLHCNRHQRALYRLPHQTIGDIKQGLYILEKQGISVRSYRPPHGYVNLAMLRFLQKEGLQMELWDILPRDWNGKSAQEILHAMEKKLHRGNVICLHDSGEGTGGEPSAPQNMIEALRLFIPMMKRKGFCFIAEPDDLMQETIGDL